MTMYVVPPWEAAIGAHCSSHRWLKMPKLVSYSLSSYDIWGLRHLLEYLAFFAGKTVEMVRAPDSYVYPAPGNIIETLLIAPFE
jgi:hypothetical protein